MANARLKIARQAGKRRRGSDAQSVEDASTEAPRETSAEKGEESPRNESSTSTHDVRDAIHDAFRDQKHAIDERLHELTMGKPLQKLHEPGYDVNGYRLKRAHQDFLLQEMVEEEAKRRLAARIGRDVKKFWTKIDKIISYKVKLQADELRKAAMDKHLKQLVAQTERYASALAMTFQEAHGPDAPDDADDNTDMKSQRDGCGGGFGRPRIEENKQHNLSNARDVAIGTHVEQERDAARAENRTAAAPDDKKSEDASDSDYSMQSVEEVDDEETIALDEQMTTQEEVDAEVALLEEEGELSIEELRARYARALQGETSDDEIGEEDEREDSIKTVEIAGSESEDGDFEPSNVEELDDESTIEAAEANGFTSEEVNEEMKLLNEESVLSIEELRARYAGAFSESEVDDEHDVKCDVDGDIDDEYNPTEEEPDDESTIEMAEANDFSKEEVDEEVGLLQEESELSIEELRARYAKALGAESESSEDEDDTKTVQEQQQVAVVEGSGEQGNRGNGGMARGETIKSKETLLCRRASLSRHVTGAGFKRPYLLTSRLSLREYQEAGVNWLISMCEKRINGILADEMGLGKTIQTISLLAHLACNQGIWGPHLIVVPTSCLVNWEMEFKRWCPAFKVLTYFGSAKRRKELRQGWSKQNAFQICITSYQLVVQDAHCFKRKKWYYLILDEAHNIKNWKSLRWQTLLNFNSQRRLLLTGTPLQNNIMELWSLMHFLMPHVFSSRREFTYWFQNPLSLMVEGEQDVNNQLVTQLHGIIRPFVLRRLKKDVAKQMPGKFEHVVSCKLSKRQRFLYEDFISRSTTRRAMFGHGRGNGGGNFMSMMNVLMQLRKVCNHPDLFEPRPIASPFDMPAIRFHAPSRCGFLVDHLVNDGRDIPFWNQNRNLPNLEIAGCDKYTSRRWRDLYYYDVNAPLPPETNVSEDVRQRYADKKDILKRLVQIAAARASYWQKKRETIAEQSRLRVEVVEDPMYGSDLIRICTLPVFISHAMDVHVKRTSASAHDWLHLSETMSAMVKDPEDRIAELSPIVSRAVCFVPKARAQPMHVIYGGSGFALTSAVSRHEFVLSRKQKLEAMEEELVKPVAQKCLSVYYEAFKRTQLFFPDKRLLQFDCGKLQQLDILLRELKRGNHRCLIFTQMSSMLNILEIFLNIHGHTYFRLDGSTKVEKRQSLMDRFNRDEKIFCFILSTRSGGLGINLTGADSVIFYDSDWNPAMDAQAQDRAHRIGQTRDVHIYRLVSEHTVEENILKKAQQKRHLDFLVMAEGQFTTDFFSKANLRELVTGEETTKASYVDEILDEEEEEPEMSYEALEDAMAQIEDEEDVVAMKGAKEEFMSEKREFEEESLNNPATSRPSSTMASTETKPSTPSSMSVGSSVSGKDDENEDMESVDGSAAAADELEEDEEHDEGEDRDISAENLAEDQSDEEDSDGSIPESEGDSFDEDDIEDSASRKRKRPSSRRGNPVRMKHRRGNERKTSEQKERADERAKEKAREKLIEMEEERKLQAWKDSVSSLKGFEDSLNPVDRYALHFREDIDPLYAYVPTAAAVESYFESQHGKLDIDKIEEEKMLEESNLITEGELIAGIMDDDGGTLLRGETPDLEETHRVLYKKERAHVHFERRRRQLTGISWEIKKCVNTNHPFYYNVDTREASWDRPAIWTKNEQFERSKQLGFSGLVPSALLLVMKCLSPYPDRHQVQFVCKNWLEAANHPSLFVKVNANDLYMRGVTLSQMLSDVSIGDTVLFGSGVYHLDDVVEIQTPIKLLATPDSHVELQMTKGRAQLKWTAKGGMLCGFHITRQSHADESESGHRPSSNWQHLLHVANGGRVCVQYCDFDGSNQGNACVAVSGSSSSRAILLNNRIYHGGSSGVLLLKGDLFMNLNSVYGNVHSGISVLGGNAILRRNKIQMNGRFGIRLLYHAGNVIIEGNVVNDHPCGNIDTENSGRRFVIRWNDMSKEEPDDLPHMHGQLLLKTFHIVEKEIKVPPKKVPTPKVVKPLSNPQDITPPLDGAEPGASIPATISTLSVVAPVTPVVVAVPDLVGVVAAVVEGPPDVSSGAVSVDAETPESADMKETPVKPEKPMPVTVNASPPIEAAATVLSSAADDTMKLETDDASRASIKCVSATADEQSKPAPLAGNQMPRLPEEKVDSVEGEETVRLPISAATPVKLKRKRRPKIEKVLVDGRIIVFSDTCEKRTDKVKKPRQMKPVIDGLKTPTKREHSHPSFANGVAGKDRNEQTGNGAIVDASTKQSSTDDTPVTSNVEGRGVLQPVVNPLSANRPHLATPATELQLEPGNASPVVVKKKRGRKPKPKPLEQQESH